MVQLLFNNGTVLQVIMSPQTGEPIESAIDQSYMRHVPFSLPDEDSPPVLDPICAALWGTSLPQPALLLTHSGKFRALAALSLNVPLSVGGGPPFDGPAQAGPWCAWKVTKQMTARCT